MASQYIKRRLLAELEDHLDRPEITLIVGPRQVGKTTLMLRLEDTLKKRGAKTLFLNLDVNADRPLFKSQETLLRRLLLAFGTRKGYAFIDEIQRLENAGLFLKGLYDMRLPYKFIVSGSGSLELKEKIHESLAGRKRVFELLPVSFEEFAEFKTGYQYENRTREFFQTDTLRGEGLLEEYQQFGGYPAVILAETSEEKRRVINEVYESYLMRDITILLGVERSSAFSDLVRLLASQIGGLVVVAELAGKLGISVPTVKRYLWYLEHTYIVRRLRPYFRNARKEITKAPVYYFQDLGMRNLASQLWGETALRANGALFENFIFTLLRDNLRAGDNLFYWRSKAGAEVDFVVAANGELVPIEAKSGAVSSRTVSRALRAFLSRYRPGRAYIAARSYRATIRANGAEIAFLPYYDLAKEVFRRNHPQLT